MPKSVAAMRDEPVGFLEGSFVQQQLDALPRSQLAFALLLLAPLFAAALFRLPVPPFQFVHQILFHRLGL